MPDQTFSEELYSDTALKEAVDRMANLIKTHATKGYVNSALENKQNKLTFDSAPSSGSSNPVTSGGVKTALDAVAEDISSLNEDLSDVNDRLDENVNDLKSAITELNSIVVIEVGQNLNNPETQTVGYYIALSGNPTEAPLYDMSDFIPIEVGKTYSVGVYKLNNALYKTRTLYAFYDANKNLVGSVTNVDNTSGLLATAPQGASFIRISGHTHFSSVVYNLMLAESSTILTTFVQYSETKILNPEIEVNGVSELEPLIGTVVFKTGENLYDPSKSVSGFLNYNGVIDTVEGQNYSTSALIPVEPNTNYYVKGFNNSFLPSNTRLVAACYNESEIFVSNTYVNENAASSITINSGNYPFIRVCANAELADRHLMVTKGQVATDFVEYVGGKYATLKVENDNLPFGSTLCGKKWAVCGDSFTNSGGTETTVPDGLYKGRPYTYPWIIGNRQNMDIIKFFEGGRTLAFPAEPGTFANSLTNPNADWYYQNIPEDVDYITIYLGINDEHHATGGGDGEDSTGLIPLGTIDDESTATYYGAWNVVLTWLITNRPNAHIGIIVTNGLSIADYRTAQISIARKYGIPFIDLNGDDRTPAMLRTVNPNIPSTIKQALITKWAVDPTGAGGTINTHPNDAAQEFESTFIENFLRSI